MRIEELSIGDWVRHTFYEENVQIARIDGDSERVLAERGKLSISCHLNHFEPIPLTPEILEKNGVLFVENFEDGEYLFACPMFSVIWLKGRGEWKFCVPNAWLYLRSVHELQHSLRLAGIEKEIEV